MANTICSKVKEWRKEQGYSLQLLADCLGVSRDTITRFEEGHISAFNLEHLSILCSKEAEINVGINPTYERKGFKSTKIGYIIPMMDCEMGYLLGEEGYTNRTRTKTDICKATGLSETAVSALEKRREITIDTTLFHNTGYSEEKISGIVSAMASVEIKKLSLLLEVIEELLINEQGEEIINNLYHAVLAKEQHISTIKRFENDKSFDMIFGNKRVTLTEAMDVVEHDGFYILPSDMAEEYFINEASFAFKELLKRKFEKMNTEMLSQEKE